VRLRILLYKTLESCAAETATANIYVSAMIGCGALAVARTDNLSSLWAILIIASLGIGGIVVPASIMTTIICPDVSGVDASPNLS
jgi:hypothetical protein